MEGKQMKEPEIKTRNKKSEKMGSDKGALDNTPRRSEKP